MKGPHIQKKKKKRTDGEETSHISESEILQNNLCLY